MTYTRSDKVRALARLGIVAEVTVGAFTHHWSFNPSAKLSAQKGTVLHHGQGPCTQNRRVHGYYGSGVYESKLCDRCLRWAFDNREALALREALS